MFIFPHREIQNSTILQFLLHFYTDSLELFSLFPARLVEAIFNTTKQVAIFPLNSATQIFKYEQHLIESIPQSSYVLTSEHLQDTPLLFPQSRHLFSSSLQGLDFNLTNQSAVGLHSREKWQLALKGRSLLKPVIQKAMLTTILQSFRYIIKPIGVSDIFCVFW